MRGDRLPNCVISISGVILSSLHWRRRTRAASQSAMGRHDASREPAGRRCRHVGRCFQRDHDAMTTITLALARWPLAATGLRSHDGAAMMMRIIAAR